MEAPEGPGKAAVQPGPGGPGGPASWGETGAEAQGLRRSGGWLEVTRCLHAGSKCRSAPKCFPRLRARVWEDPGGFQIPFLSSPSSVTPSQGGAVLRLFHHCAFIVPSIETWTPASLFLCPPGEVASYAVCVSLRGPLWPFRCSHKRPTILYIKVSPGKPLTWFCYPDWTRTYQPMDFRLDAVDGGEPLGNFQEVHGMIIILF